MFFLPGIGGWEGGSGLGARLGTGQQEAQRRQPSNMDARIAHLPKSSTEAGRGAALCQALCGPQLISGVVCKEIREVT